MEQGFLHLEVNGTVIATASLSGTTSDTVRGIRAPGSGSGRYLNSDGSGFTNLSITGSSINNDGSEFTFFQHRTGRFLVSTASQRNGWNYARIIHRTSGDQTTNYVEWINDPSGAVNDLSVTNPRVENVSLSGAKYLSGVKYNTGATAKYKADINNLYRNIYPVGNVISFATSNSSIPTENLIRESFIPISSCT